MGERIIAMSAICASRSDVQSSSQSSVRWYASCSFCGDGGDQMNSNHKYQLECAMCVALLDAYGRGMGEAACTKACDLNAEA